MKKKIIVAGLGAGDMDQLPLGIYKLLQKDMKKYVRTNDHPVLKDLEAEGMTFTSFDSVYEEHEQFSDVYEEITNHLLSEAEKYQEILYAVPGHPLVAESTVQRLLDKENQGEVTLEIVGGQSFLDGMFTALKMDPIEGFQLLDGTAIQQDQLQIRQHMIIAQVYDSFIASEVKLTLMDKLPDDYMIKVVTAAGSEEEVIQALPLYQLDRVTEINNLTAVYVPPVREETQLYHDFYKLREIIATLRGPDGCPWDKKQTHLSLKKYLLEESYEVLEAIDEGDDDHLVEELGDVLLQIMLHAQIGEDVGMFSIDDIVKGLSEKMIRRHPHVFGEKDVANADEVVGLWEDIKRKEKGIEEQDEEFQSILKSIPVTLPSLLKSYKLQKKAATVGFDWDDAAPMWDKLEEEIDEFLLEIKAGKKDRAEKELGDILFVVANLARFYGIDPEQALIQTNNKFTNRFQYIEKKVFGMGKKMENLSLEELDAIWDEAKTLE